MNHWEVDLVGQGQDSGRARAEKGSPNVEIARE